MVRQKDTTAAQVLENMDVTLTQVRSVVESRIAPGAGRKDRDMRLTPSAKNVINFAYAEGRQLNDNELGAEHLLLGLSARVTAWPDWRLRN